MLLLVPPSLAAPAKSQGRPLQPRSAQYSVCQSWCANKLSNPAEVDTVCANPQCSACDDCKGATSTAQPAEEPAKEVPLDSPPAAMLSNTYGTDDGLANFKDVTESLLPEEWQGWGHTGKAHKHQGTPAFVDWVGDGKMSYIYHNHYESEPMTDWDVGIPSDELGVAAFQPMNSMLHLTESTEVRDGGFFCHVAKEGLDMRCNSDSHGIAALDIDHDGHKDMFISTGADHGLGQVTNATSALLFWGRSPEEGDPAPIALYGGRDAALDAGINMSAASGRFSYWLDANGDGLYDVVTATEPRADNTFAPGYLYLQSKEKPRTFLKQDWAEYGMDMVLTDVDGDGKIAELVISRHYECLPDSRKEDVSDLGAAAAKANENKPGEDAAVIAAHCDSHPPATVVVYDVGGDKGLTYRGTIGTVNNPEMDSVEGLQAADLDGDSVADLAVLRPNRVELHLSSARTKGELPKLDEPSAVVQWPGTETLGTSLRVGDFDLDGSLELLVLSQTGKAWPHCGSYDRPPQKLPCTLHRMVTRNSAATSIATAFLADATTHGGAARALPLQAAAATETDLWASCNYGRSKVEKGEHTLPIYEETCRIAAGEEEAEFRLYGASVIDFSNDGYPDVILSYSYGKMLFLENQIAAQHVRTDDAASSDGWVGNRFLAVTLKGVASNAHGVGASLLLTVEPRSRASARTTAFQALRPLGDVLLLAGGAKKNVTGAAKLSAADDGAVTLLREVGSVCHDTNWLGQRDDRITFGLGEHGAPSKLEIRWPSGVVQVIDDADHQLTDHLNAMSAPLVVTEPSSR
jgi:hypothetical protein